MKRLDRILDIKPMRHQPSQLHDPTLHQPDRARPRVGVAVLELQVDLLRAKAHERETHLGFAHADDEHLPAELDAVDGGRDARLDARALERDGGLDAAGQSDDLPRGVLVADAALDLEGAHAGDEVLREGEAAVVNVRDDDGFGAGGGGAEEGDEADGPGAADEDGVAEADAGALDAGEGDGEGLEQGAVLKGHGADLVAPDGRVVDVAAEEAVDRRRREEAHREAAVVAARQARFAVAADDVRFDGDAVADGEGGDRGVRGEDDTRGFVAEDVRVCDDHGADAAGVPEVYVGSVLRGGRWVRLTVSEEIFFVLEKDREGDVWYPQIPVLLMPMVTSPSLRPSPFLTLSSVGPDSATQSLCSGSVKTPTLGKLTESVTVAIVALF